MSDETPMARVTVTIEGTVPFMFLAETFDGILRTVPMDGQFTFKVEGE